MEARKGKRALFILLLLRLFPSCRGSPITRSGIPVAHGTTTVSFIVGDQIIAAVDSRASLGNLVGSRQTEKVLPVTRHVLGTMAGGAADCSYWIRNLSAQMRLWELVESSRATVPMAATVLANLLRQQRGST